VRRRVVLILLALVAAGAIAVVAGASRGGGTTGLVTGVTVGDTLQVKLASGKLETVRVLGVVAPRASSCYAAESTEATRALTVAKTVQLSGSGSSAYVMLPDGTDLGRQLVESGIAQIDAWGSAFSRFASYVPVQQAAETANKGMWGACAADVAVTLVSTPDAVAIGDRIRYTATITNAGPLAATNVSLNVRAPAGNPFDTAASLTEHGACSVRGWYAHCSFDVVPAHGTAGAAFTVDAKKEGAAAASALVRLSGCIRAACGSTPLHDADVQNDRTGAFTSIVAQPLPGQPPPPPRQLPVNHWVDGGNCDPHYPTVCIPPPLPDLDCADLPFRQFQVKHEPTEKTPDPHSFDNNFDGVGCQFDDY